MNIHIFANLCVELHLRVCTKVSKKIDYSVRNDKVTEQALQEIQEKND